MTYEEVGFNKLLYRTELTPSNNEMTEDQSSVAITSISGAAILGGTTKSVSGKILIDWDIGQILIGDKANWRILLGEDGL
jgi:hypothetical protein